MKANTNLLFLLFIIILGSFTDSFCQVIDKANRRYIDMAYYEAIPQYKRALRKDSTNIDAWAKLGDCYRLINENEKAERCYARVVKATGTLPIYKLYYALVLMSNRNYQESKKWFEAYQREVPGDTHALEMASSVGDTAKFYTDTNAYTLRSVKFNSIESDYCPIFYKDGLVFTSSRPDISFTKRVHSWTGKNFLSLYYVKGNLDKFGTPELFAKSIQTMYNNGPVSFNKTQDVMYLTRNNIEDGTVKSSSNKVVKMKIFSATLKNGQWGNVTPFQYNSDEYSCVHPCLSPDETKLYFVSDMPGTLGGMDIWVCQKSGNGWDKPVNLGTAINSMGNELFPTMTSDSLLYFSSNDHEGLGGLDIFCARITSSGYVVKNMGVPINSSDDDFGLVMDTSLRNGYMSSNRIHQGENDDIYSVHLNTVKFDGLVYDAVNGRMLDASSVKIVEEGIEKAVSTTRSDGHFSANVVETKNYLMIASHENYLTDTIRLTTAQLIAANGNIFVRIPLYHARVRITIEGKIFAEGSGQPIASARVSLLNLTTGDTVRFLTAKDGLYSFPGQKPNMKFTIISEVDNCAWNSVDTSTDGILSDTIIHIDIGLYCLKETVTLKNIYFDLDKSNIRPDAAVELNKLVLILKKYPGMKIELRSHTDCRATKEYNMRLSEDRSKSAVKYLQEHGIVKSRLTMKGFGETLLVNGCACEDDHEVPCTEEQHQLNRRTEIRILLIR